MEEIKLQASKREVIGKKVKLLRLEGKLPAVIYGRGLKTPIPIYLDTRETVKIIKGISPSSLIKLDADGDKHTVLLRDQQRDVVTGNYLHLDFLAISMTEKVKTFVRLVLEGVAPAVSTLEAVLITGIDSIEVEALPGDLPESISVDISGIENYGNGVHVRDIDLPDGVECLTPLGDMIVVATAPSLPEEEEVEEDLDIEEGDELTEPELIEKGKQEEESD